MNGRYSHSQAAAAVGSMHGKAHFLSPMGRPPVLGVDVSTRYQVCGFGLSVSQPVTTEVVNLLIG